MWVGIYTDNNTISTITNTDKLVLDALKQGTKMQWNGLLKFYGSKFIKVSIYAHEIFYQHTIHTSIFRRSDDWW